MVRVIRRLKHGWLAVRLSVAIIVGLGDCGERDRDDNVAVMVEGQGLVGAKLVAGLIWARATLCDLALPLTDALTQLKDLAADVNIQIDITDQQHLANACVLCMTELCAVRFDCGHSPVCTDCAVEFQQHGSVCPNCREPISIGEPICIRTTISRAPLCRLGMLHCWEQC